MKSKSLFNANGLTAVYTPSDIGESTYSLWVEDGAYHSVMSFTKEQWETLAQFFGFNCSVECEGPRLSEPLPKDWVPENWSYKK